MDVTLSRNTLDLISRFARRHDVGGLWVSDGKHARSVHVPPDPVSHGNAGALALRYPLARGLTLLVGVRECRPLNIEEQTELRQIIAAMDTHAQTS